MEIDLVQAMFWSGCGSLLTATVLLASGAWRPRRHGGAASADLRRIAVDLRRLSAEAATLAAEGSPRPDERAKAAV